MKETKMKVRGMIEFEIYDELLASHDGDKVPPPNDIADWDFRDLFRANDEALIDEDGDCSLELELCAERKAPGGRVG
jgi:hypothetical protein